MFRLSFVLLGVTAATAATIAPSGSQQAAPAAASPAASSAVSEIAVPMEADASIRPTPSMTGAIAVERFHGVARPASQADLPSMVRGIIQQVHVREGQTVHRGDPLVTLDNRVPQARLAAATVKSGLTGALRRAEVQSRMAIRRRDRLRSALQSGAAGEFELEEAEATCEQAAASVQQQQDLLRAAEAERQLAAAQLDQYTISAPFDGLVTEIHQRSGAVDPSAPVVSVANVGTLEVEMHLPAEFYGSVQSGQQIALRAGVPVSEVMEATVVSTAPIINSASNTFRCLLRLPNPAARHPAGFIVTLNADPRTDRTATAPRSSRRSRQ